MVSVDEALKKGRWLLFWVPLIILFGSTGLFVGAFLYLTTGDVIWVNIVCTIAILSLPAFICFLYFFFMLPRWRIWAFSNVRNVHELKQRAILRQIYPKDESFVWRLVIMNAEQKQQIDDLQRRFDVPDEFVDDPSIPSETTYSYSPILSFFYLLSSAASLSLTVIFLFNKELLVSLLLLVSTFVFVRMTYQRYKLNGEPLLKISIDGITTIDNGFFPWKDIENEHVFFVSAGQASYYGVSFEVHGQKITKSMKEITGLSTYKIDHVLRTYRGRYQSRNGINH
jgi:hypothetical protein